MALLNGNSSISWSKVVTVYQLFLAIAVCLRGPYTRTCLCISIPYIVLQILTCVKPSGSVCDAISARENVRHLIPATFESAIRVQQFVFMSSRCGD
jgi:hypothetical protein